MSTSKLRTFTVSRHLPFSCFYVIGRKRKKSYSILSIDHLCVNSMTEEDKQDMSTREDALFLFTVDAPDLEEAGNIIDALTEEILV